jgi:GGDEF domain-containing protein
MTSPPVIEDEPERLASVRSLRALDTPPEPEFDELVELAAWTCHAPMAALSLITEDRQWFKATIGLDLVETPRDTSFCGHTITGSTTLVVPDTNLDPRFVDNPFVVDAPEIRFYAGVPIVVDNELNIGTLCVLDTRPRQLFSDERRALEIIARQAAAHLHADRLEWNAIDPLTGASTALAADRWLTCRAQGRPAAAIHFEVAGPPGLSDGHDHEAADHMLGTAARRLRVAAPQGAMVARIGGNEFVVLLDGVDAADLDERIERTRIAFGDMNPIGGQTSLGFATTTDGHSHDELIDAARRATALTRSDDAR